MNAKVKQFLFVGAIYRSRKCVTYLDKRRRLTVIAMLESLHYAKIGLIGMGGTLTSEILYSDTKKRFDIYIRRIAEKYDNSFERIRNSRFKPLVMTINGIVKMPSIGIDSFDILLKECNDFFWRIHEKYSRERKAAGGYSYFNIAITPLGESTYNEWLNWEGLAELNDEEAEIKEVLEDITDVEVDKSV